MEKGRENVKGFSCEKVIKMHLTGLHRPVRSDILTEHLGSDAPEGHKSSLNIGENASCEILKENHK